MVWAKKRPTKIPSVETLSKELNLKQNLSPGAYSEELRRNLVQPIISGTGRISQNVCGCRLVQRQSAVLLLTEKTLMQFPRRNDLD